MKKTLLLLGSAMLGVASANAVPFRDIDAWNSTLIDQHNTTANGTFDIVTGDNDVNITIVGSGYSDAGSIYSDIAGFVQGNYTIDSATLFFYFRDDTDPGNATESVTVSIDGSVFVNQQTIANGLFSIFGGGATVGIMSSLSDGILSYEVARHAGDFYFDYARLEVTATLNTQPPTNVPDGGSTAILMGLGLLGFAGLRHRR